MRDLFEALRNTSLPLADPDKDASAVALLAALVALFAVLLAFRGSRRKQRQAEERYRTLFERMHEAVFISTPDGRLLDFNQAFMRLFGYTREELLELDIAQDLYAVPDQRRAFVRQMEVDGFSKNTELLVRRKDGNEIWVLDNSFAVRASSGRIQYYQGFLLDTTEKKRAEDELRRRNTQLHALNQIATVSTQSLELDQMLDAVLHELVEVFHANTGSIYLFNKSDLTLHRHAARGHSEPSLQTGAVIALPIELLDRCKSGELEVLTHGEVEVPESVANVVRAAGLESWMWGVMKTAGEILGIVAVGNRNLREFSGTDRELMGAVSRHLATTITNARLFDDTRRAYEDLRRTQEQLLQSEKMSAVGQLISGVAHELNNPLTAILGYAQLLESEPLPDRARDFVQKLYKQTQRTHRVVQNLLSFARQRKPQRVETDLRRVLEDTLALRDYDLKLNNIEVVREFAESVPTVIADPHQMEQVFLNIVNNASDAMLEIRRGGTVRVRIYADSARVYTEFHDSGPGLKDGKKIFDPFFTTKPAGKGTGLGLSICYGIVKEHGGEITAYNHPDGGAVFRLSLPISAKSAQTTRDAIRANIEPQLKGRILLVDDEEALLEFEREVLMKAGAEVSTASSGEEALEILKQEDFDVVVSDGRMPGAVNGIDLFEWVLKNKPELRGRVMLTVSNVAEVDTPFLQQHNVPCLVKPFAIADLIAVVRRIGSNRGLATGA